MNIREAKERALKQKLLKEKQIEFQNRLENEARWTQPLGQPRNLRAHSIETNQQPENQPKPVKLPKINIPANKREASKNTRTKSMQVYKQK